MPAIATLNAADYERIVVFTGAGMSAESGIPTYRGSGGVWNQYDWRHYACQEAFEADPGRVIEFHDLRRETCLDAAPHAGHAALAAAEQRHPGLSIVTQNIDGMHQRAGSRRVTELHGSLWRVRCPEHGVSEIGAQPRQQRRCPECSAWLRPAITWFGDALDEEVFSAAGGLVAAADLFISVGTSGVVWPAAGFAEAARAAGARCVEINPADTEMSALYDDQLRAPASSALVALFGA
ncbi:MAG: NAD-dependent deacylase, partial [Gammaproteobacteria bacterium]|nr:NAD-dependent deacylase [Gammaproteobacteria bacterium]